MKKELELMESQFRRLERGLEDRAVLRSCVYENVCVINIPGFVIKALLEKNECDHNKIKIDIKEVCYCGWEVMLSDGQANRVCDAVCHQMNMYWDSDNCKRILAQN